MPIPSSVEDLDQAAANNSPGGSEPIGQNLDGYLRAHAAIIRQVSDTAKMDSDGAMTAATTDIQLQKVTAFTSAGAAPNFTLTSVPAITAYAANQRFRCKFHAAGTTGSNTLNVSGLGAKSLKQYDSTGAKVPAGIAAGTLADVEYDGVDFVILNPLPSASPPGLRNRIINGQMKVDQRNNGSVQTFTAGSALTYCIDRFFGYCTGANITGQRIALSNGQNRYRFTGAASNTGVGFGQRHEAANTLDMAGQKATLQAKLSSTSLTTINWTAYYANTADAFGTLASPTKTQIATGTFAISAAEATYSAQIAIPAAATTGIEIVFSGGALLAAQTLTIGDVQLELGDAATTFEVRPAGLELALCQRYYLRFAPGASNLFGIGNSPTTSNLDCVLNFPVSMMAAPTSVEQTGSATDYQGFGTAPAVCTAVPTFNNASRLSASVRFTCAASTFSGNGAYTGRANTAAGFLGFTAEL